jgi:hypothetical protein
MYLEFYGAAEEVTGSLHRLHVGELDIVLDCGLFQGHRAEANRLNRELPEWTTAAHALVLSHAHLDHSGNIPTLVKRGFEGNVFCTPPTRDLCSVMLRDAALIQQQDARYINKHNQRDGSNERVEPLFDVDDAQRAVVEPASAGDCSAQSSSQFNLALDHVTAPDPGRREPLTLACRPRPLSGRDGGRGRNGFFARLWRPPARRQRPPRKAAVLSSGQVGMPRERFELASERLEVDH